MPYALFIQIYFGIVACNLAFGHALMVLVNIKHIHAMLRPKPAAPLLTEMSLLSSGDQGYSGIDDAEALEDKDHQRADSLNGSERNECDETACSDQSEPVGPAEKIAGEAPNSPQRGEI